MKTKTREKIKEIFDRNDDSIHFSLGKDNEILVDLDLPESDVDDIIKFEFGRVPKKEETKINKLKLVFSNMLDLIATDAIMERIRDDKDDGEGN